MKRRYIIPLSERDVRLAEWLDDLAPYGVTRQYLANQVIEAVLKDIATTSLTVIRSLQEAVNNEFESDMHLCSNQVAHEVYESIIDKLTLACIEACDVLAEHLRNYVDAIEQMEYDRGVKTDNMQWNVIGTHGQDIIVEVSDE